jgi:formiminoglutamate deiminase
VTSYLCEYAWLPDGLAEQVLIEVDGDRLARVERGTDEGGVNAPADPVRLAGVTLPGLANAHSHAFHRALRGDHSEGTFWTWREAMYALADRLDPDTYHRLARAVFAEFALAGITCVGEFHYLHHARGGARYDEPNVMGSALLAAAADAGIRITLLDACYLTGGVAGEPLSGAQRRFGDGDADAWAARVSLLAGGPHARIGAAVHSVRAVPPDAIATVAKWAEGAQVPLHVHLSEQPAENEACLAQFGRTPTAVLAAAGALGPHTVAVHATHLTRDDLAALGGQRITTCLCPTTERDLADGLGPGRALAEQGSPLCLGSDSHAVVDLFEEARAVEAHERVRTGRRGHFTGAELLTAATAAGHAALGWPDAGQLRPGARADLVTVALDTIRTAGVPPAAILSAATAADVRHVVVDGRVVVNAGQHCLVPDTARELARAIEALR